jgi:hypothetical protein
MHNRREFLQYGAAIAASVAALNASARLAPARPPLELIVDRSLVGARAFAAAAAAQRDVRWIDGDLGAAWMNHVEPLWRRQPAVLAGLTRAGALFCLELFARDYGRAVVHRAAHTPGTAGDYTHAVAGHDAARCARDLARSGAAWPTVAAALATTAPRAGTAPLELLELVRHPERGGTPAYSWVIAPRARPHT